MPNFAVAKLLSSATITGSMMRCKLTRFSNARHSLGSEIGFPADRPRCRWIEEILTDNNGKPPADLWREAVGYGQRRATSRPSQASDGDERYFHPV